MSARVALVLGTSTGGVGTHVARLAQGLAAAGREVTVHGPASTDALFGFSGTGATFAPVEIPASPRLKDATAVATLRRAWRAEPPAVIHAHGLRAGLVAGLARPNAVPLVVTWHNAVLAEGFRGRTLALLERRVARSAEVTLCVSGDLVTRVRDLGGRDVRLAPVLAPPLPPPTADRAAVRADLGVADGAPLILSVGRLHPQKAHHVLITAAARWRARTPQPVVLIAGTGPSFIQLGAQISAERAPVTLLGYRNDVPNLLAAADVAVVTSVWEGSQLFAQEALRAGVPLVATAVGGQPELVGDGAVLVPVGDVDAVDAAVVRLLDHPDERQELSARARARAAQWPTEEQTIAAILGVYDELASVSPVER
jgi:glycosyltransferase involved in cell wall biosynthesis